ncbi:siderophore-interacting protein [Altererythrobacter indicus]|uniref:Siderophore-interacting protein n=1 Tax=Altericroceibacterium indicum TaxID=374177 RepID=A0A845AC53_9SPHN|nr:siderophore-interacting protein [Altericroceibacterium indicum]MXP26823.1 siderophore-interacting protein [Altericroceibacterium indicum]
MTILPTGAAAKFLGKLHQDAHAADAACMASIMADWDAAGLTIGQTNIGAVVVACEDMGAGFRLLTLESAALKGVRWTAGQKIQIATGSPSVTRTYTPIEWNTKAGRFCILGYAHGDGPGSNWLRTLSTGDECYLFGPCASLDVSDTASPLALFGDETSMGLAYALTYQYPERPVTCQFEVDKVAGCEKVMTQIGLCNATLVRRRSSDAHLDEMEAALTGCVSIATTFVLTGKTSTVQRLRQRLKLWDVPAHRIIAKAYWAPGRTDLV